MFGSPAVAVDSGRVPGRHAVLVQDGVVTLVAFLALVLWDVSPGDRWVVHQLGNAAGFVWREHWLTARLLHDGGRWLGWAMLAGLGGVAVACWRRPSERRRVLWAIAAAMSCVLVIPVFKHYSLTSCPWSLADFGGQAHLVSHWLWGVPDGGPGGCFPSGHASTAFCMFSVYFALRPTHPRAARAAVWGVCVAGAIFGWAQVMRGAHYPSHTLWTAWICWVLCALLWHGAGLGNRAT